MARCLMRFQVALGFALVHAEITIVPHDTDLVMIRFMPS
jgi:hypothetical protein